MGSLFKKRVQGRVRLEVEYKPLCVPGAAEEEEQQDKVAAELQQRDKVTAELQLANRRAPKGGATCVVAARSLSRIARVYRPPCTHAFRHTAARDAYASCSPVCLGSQGGKGSARAARS